MRIFKNKAFNRWARDKNLTADDLRSVAEEMKAGTIGAAPGGKIFKKRVALSAGGKSGGARVIIGFKLSGNLFFIYGYAKNERANITKTEKSALQKLASVYLDYTNKQLDRAVNKKIIFEIKVKDDG